MNYKISKIFLAWIRRRFGQMFECETFTYYSDIRITVGHDKQMRFGCGATFTQYTHSSHVGGHARVITRDGIVHRPGNYARGVL